MLLFNHSSLVARSGDWEEVKMTLGEKIKHMRGVKFQTDLAGSILRHAKDSPIHLPLDIAEMPLLGSCGLTGAFALFPPNLAVPFGNNGL